MTNFRHPRHLGFYLAAGLGLIVAVGCAVAAPPLALPAGANTFFLAYLLLATTQIVRMKPEFLRRHADQEDAPALLILVVMAVAVVVSAGSLFLVLNQRAGSPGPQLVLSVASVLLGWFAIHTMWAMHYAFEYYEAEAGKRGGGLAFPGGEEPDGTAFLYFSYVVGMTAQTSDTAVVSNAMRRLVTLHGVFAFFFNTVIVAASVNVAIALAR